MAKVQRALEGERPDLALSPDPMVKVRILKFGDGRVSTGDHHSSGGEVLAEAGEFMDIPRTVAEALEKRGFAEIEEAKKA